MNASNPIGGIFLHAIGAVSASACYLPSTRTEKWSWGSFWLVQGLFAWILMPLCIGYLTVPGFFEILREAPAEAFWMAFLLGAVYGFGSMSFGWAIQYIGYSLTYTLAIGISALVGTLMPLLIFGGLREYFASPGGGFVLTGMIISILGVAGCGWAGFRRERENGLNAVHVSGSNMFLGLLLTIIAGLLSGVFNISLEFGQPISDMAAARGAGNFEGNAKLIVSTAGCWLVNVIWFLVIGFKRNTLREFRVSKELGIKILGRNIFWSALAGSLWFAQFFFYGMGHVRMGRFQFASWVLHMSMLIFFSYLIGVMMKEWKKVSKTTYMILIIALLVLILSFVIISFGSVAGDGMES